MAAQNRRFFTLSAACCYSERNSVMAQFWNEKRYHSLDFHMKQTFGDKIYKIAVDGGFTCPNRDGTKGWGGCIFCSAGGSGDFAASRQLNIRSQIDSGRKLLSGKHTGSKYMAYFQAFTNTYAPVSLLRKRFTEAIMQPDIVGLSIATRPDCLPEDVLLLLAQLNSIKPVWVELGLQTIHEKTACFIRRGYPLSVFSQAAAKLSQYGLETIAHVILGLPGESEDDMLATVSWLAKQPIQGIKLALLHVLKGTDLGDIYMKEPILLPSMDSYIDIVIRCLEILPPEIVIHRLTGDGPRKLLIAPLWSTDKKNILNTLQKEMKLRNTWQGRLYAKEDS